MDATMRGVIQALAYRLEDIRACSDVEQALVRLGILHDSLRLAVRRDSHPSYFSNSN
jgi:hypothetical protein